MQLLEPVLWILQIIYAYSLQQVLLQPEEELLRKRSSELVSEGAALKPKKTFGKMKVQGTFTRFLS